MATKTRGFFGQLLDSLFPPENRLVAAVAGIKTFGQTIRGSAAVGALLGAGVTVTDLANIDWTVLAFAAGSILLTSFIAGADAYFNNLANGLSPKYTDAVVKQIQRTGTAPSTPLAEAVQDAAKKLDNVG
jgi:hypothetical protein